ncbi:MAG: hypothetical protein HFJ17_02395 [Clostridia bacterium]|nr:hypothetical protein [Clostridia bacterium]
MKGLDNKTKIIIGIISAIFIIAIIVGVVLYFTTDIFTSKEKKFQRYIVQNIETLNNFTDISGETQYRKTLEDNSFNENSKVTLKYINKEGNEENFTGNIMGTDNKDTDIAYKDIKVVSGDKDVIEIEYLKESNIYGLHFVNIADKFATIDISNNISTILKYFGLDSKLNTDKINKVKLSEIFDLTKEEIQQLESKYLSIFMEKITKDCYSSQNDKMITLSNGQSITANSYILTLDAQQVQNTYESILSQLSNDEIILTKLGNIDNKIKETGIKLNKDIKTQFIEKIDELEKNIKIVSELKITLYELDGTPVRTTIEYGDKTIDIDQNSSNSITIKYSNLVSEEVQNTNITIKKENNALEVNYQDSNNRKVDITRNIEIAGNKAKSDMSLKYSSNDVKGLEIGLNRDIITGTANQIPTSFEAVGKILLNDYEDQSIDYAFTTLRNRIMKALRNKRNETNSSLINYLIEYNNQLEEADKKEEEMKRKRFNSKFEDYEGKNLEQDIVLNMLDEAGKNMSNYQTIGRNQVKIYIKEGRTNKDLAEEIKENLAKIEGKKYNIKIEYDENAWINQITIEIIQEETEQNQIQR